MNYALSNNKEENGKHKKNTGRKIRKRKSRN